jgi:hypothetical protein
MRTHVFPPHVFLPFEFESGARVVAETATNGGIHPTRRK